MNKVIIAFFGIVVSSAYAETAYVRAVDEAGTPFSGAAVSVSWFEKPLFSSALKVGSEKLTCDRQGMTSIRLNGKAMVTLDSAVKEGYVFEHYLNLDQDPLSGKRDTRSNPRRIVLRRLEPVSFLLVADSGGFRHSKGAPIQFSIDLFHKLRKEWKIPSYDDFFVSSRYHEDQRRWETVFWTTNANCGLVATVNRRFTAPGTGYVSRIEVSQEDFANKAFTLYLKTRNPSIYVMIPFGLSDLQSRGPAGQVGAIWDFRYKDARINPYGGREMEMDGRAVDRIGRDLRAEALHALLKEKKYPPRPDMVARMENERESKVLRIREQKLRNEMSDIIHQLKNEKKQFKDDPRKIQEIEKREKELDTKYLPELKMLNKEIDQLRKEAHTLNLPEEKREDKK